MLEKVIDRGKEIADDFDPILAQQSRGDQLSNR